MKRTFNKLVRDNIPRLIRESGRKCTFQILNEEEYQDALIDKIVEEVEEFRVTGNEEELADLYEALECLVNLKNYEPMHIDYLKLMRREARGSYSERILLKEVEE